MEGGEEERRSRVNEWANDKSLEQISLAYATGGRGWLVKCKPTEWRCLHWLPALRCLVGLCRPRHRHSVWRLAWGTDTPAWNTHIADDTDITDTSSKSTDTINIEILIMVNRALWLRSATLLYLPLKASPYRGMNWSVLLNLPRVPQICGVVQGPSAFGISLIDVSTVLQQELAGYQRALEPHRSQVTGHRQSMLSLNISPLTVSHKANDWESWSESLHSALHCIGYSLANTLYHLLGNYNMIVVVLIVVLVNIANTHHGSLLTPMTAWMSGVLPSSMSVTELTSAPCANASAMMGRLRACEAL